MSALFSKMDCCSQVTGIIAENHVGSLLTSEVQFNLAVATRATGDGGNYDEEVFAWHGWFARSRDGRLPPRLLILAARPLYQRPPPPIVAPIYDWSGFYNRPANGGWGQSRKLCGFLSVWLA